jgi:predicted glutamine amidotransferase
MCIAILNKTSLLPIETIKHSFNNNPDGAGLCAIIGGKIVIHKELNSKNYKSFYAKYVELRTKTQLPVLLHFRIGTSGIKDERNIHPFLINSKLALIHNGMISYNVINKDFSDTWHFTQLLKSLKNPARLLNSKSLEYQMLSAFTKGSKIALLHVSGEFSILNETAGKWHDDTWYSNETYKACDYRNIGGRVVYNSRNNSRDIWGYDDSGYYGYGYTNYAKTDDIKDINRMRY